MGFGRIGEGMGRKARIGIARNEILNVYEWNDMSFVKGLTLY